MSSNCKSHCKGKHSCCPDCGWHSFSFTTGECLFCNADIIFNRSNNKTKDKNTSKSISGNVSYFNCGRCKQEVIKARNAQGKFLKVNAQPVTNGDYDLVHEVFIYGNTYKYHKC